MNYAYVDSKFYFHGAMDGHKIDAVKQCDKASFCIIDMDRIVAEEYTSYFKSVIAFGRIQIVEESAFRKAMEALGSKYNPEQVGETTESMVERTRSCLCAGTDR